MFILISAVIVAAAVVWTGVRIARALAAPQRTASHVTDLMAMLAPGMAAAASDPRALIAWHGVARTARTLFPEDFAALDRAAGGTFPFTVQQIQDAHARWTTAWLAWERTHDAECKLRAVTTLHDLGDEAATPYGRARLEAVERDKLDRYQQRYEQYTRIARALQSLAERP